jgi:prenyltransferase beta subunit
VHFVALGRHNRSRFFPPRFFHTSFFCRKIGGFSKWADVHPDVLHTYFSICGLAFIGEPGIEEVNPSLGFSQKAVDRVKEINRI